VAKELRKAFIPAIPRRHTFLLCWCLTGTILYSYNQ